MPSIAIQVAEPAGYIGAARTFRVDPPLTDPSQGNRAFDYVTVVLILNYGLRVELFGANSDGTARSMNPLPGSFILQRTVTLDDACTWGLLTAGGYEITELFPEPAEPLPPLPEPEPEPETEPEPATPLPFEVVPETTPEQAPDN